MAISFCCPGLPATIACGNPRFSQTLSLLKLFHGCCSHAAQHCLNASLCCRTTVKKIKRPANMQKASTTLLTPYVLIQLCSKFCEKVLPSFEPRPWCSPFSPDRVPVPKVSKTENISASFTPSIYPYILSFRGSVL